MTITAAADGSALGNPGPAGWAWYVDDANWGAGGWKHATNNQGELKAVLELFRATAHLDDDLLVLCDSQYVINSVTKWMKGWKAKGWRKGDGKPVMNLDLLTEIDEALVGRRFRFEWVKGHVGHPLNEAADIRARTAAEAFQRGRAPATGPGYTRGGAAAAAAAQTDVPTRAAATVATPPNPRAATAPAAPAHPGLFDFDGPDFNESDDDLSTVTVTLSPLELTRLQQRAARAGVGIDEFLRGLI
ncbi:ribonuclease HI [Cryobacterium frigoriphilum]|uniref:Ribonuclease H n=1 Tax=Cryobacterium frigoriphilum TaxID=1259150 RepID=A0A4R9AAC2_9MICO|nr:RNase H family protein [Cryobacterium frigoriphilum]TFD54743.1 ribonuclease HI [Cryobacterium frigoriphilum]